MDAVGARGGGAARPGGGRGGRQHGGRGRGGGSHQEDHPKSVLLPRTALAFFMYRTYLQLSIWVFLLSIASVIFFFPWFYFLHRASTKVQLKCPQFVFLFLQYIGILWYVAVPKYRKSIPTIPVRTITLFTGYYRD